MGLTGTLKQISLRQCPHCNQEYGKHAKKQFMRCLYTANHNLYNAIIENNELKQEINQFVMGDKEELKVPEKITVDANGSVEIEQIES